jgi:hypothetical protein
VFDQKVSAMAVHPIEMNDHDDIVIVDLETIKTSDRMLGKCLRIYCYEWTCGSPIFDKFQV